MLGGWRLGSSLFFSVLFATAQSLPTAREPLTQSLPTLRQAGVSVHSVVSAISAPRSTPASVRAGRMSWKHCWTAMVASAWLMAPRSTWVWGEPRGLRQDEGVGEGVRGGWQ